MRKLVLSLFVAAIFAAVSAVPAHACGMMGKDGKSTCTMKTCPKDAVKTEDGKKFEKNHKKVGPKDGESAKDPKKSA